MRLQQTGYKSHRPILRYGELKLAQGDNYSSVGFEIFVCLVVCLFLCTLMSSINSIIHDWFSNIFPQKILHFLQPVKPKLKE